MPVDKIEAHPSVLHDFGRLALQRGPIVYCFEDADHQTSVREMMVPPEAVFTPTFEASTLGGVVVLEGQGALAPLDRWRRALYLPHERHCQKTKLRAVPYCTWDNRTPGGMVVWIPRA